MQGDNWTTGYKIDRQVGINQWQNNWMVLDASKTTFTDSNFPSDQDIKYRVSTKVNGYTSVAVDMYYGLTQLDTITITNKTYNSVTIKSDVLNEVGGAVSEWGIVYGTSPNPTILDTKITATTSGNIGMTTTLSGLDNTKTYYARTYALNKRGESYGKQKIITPNPFILAQLDDVSLGLRDYTFVYITANIKSNGGAPITESGFVYSTKPGATINDSKWINTSGATYYTAKIENLVNAIPYYIRSYAINSVGVSYSSEISFKTYAYSYPFIDPLTVNNIDATRVHLSSNFTNNGGDVNATWGIVYGNAENPTLADNIATTIFPLKGTGHPFEAYISNLNPNQTYHARTYTQNVLGVFYTYDVHFTTTSISVPTVDAVTLLLVNKDLVQLGSQVILDGGSDILEAGFVYSTSPVPTLADNKAVSDYFFSPGYQASCQLKNLTLRQTYYVRCYAQNATGTSYGPINNFTPSEFSLPQLYSSVSISFITTTSVSLYCSILSNGGDPSAEAGFVYGDNPNPTISDNRVIADPGWAKGSGESKALTNLQSYHLYHVRAYMKNTNGIVYSGDTSFITKYN